MYNLYKQGVAISQNGMVGILEVDNERDPVNFHFYESYGRAQVLKKSPTAVV